MWALPVSAGMLAQFRTPLGDIEVELYDQDKPVTVGNFRFYVESGFWRDMFMHRWVPGFVLQGGGYRLANRGTPENAFEAVPTFGTITNEFSVGRRFSNTNGTIAMARAGGQTNSAGSEWFFNLADNSELDAVDGGFTVFGRVLRGMEVLALFARQPADGSLVLYDFQPNVPANQGVLKTVPLRVVNEMADLVFVDITLLNVQVRPVSGGREIAWNSVSGKTHHVEFTRQFPPVWESVHTVAGTGQRMVFTDAAADAHRFYRVTVDY